MSPFCRWEHSEKLLTCPNGSPFPKVPSLCRRCPHFSVESLCFRRLVCFREGSFQLPTGFPWHFSLDRALCLNCQRTIRQVKRGLGAVWPLRWSSTAGLGLLFQGPVGRGGELCLYPFFLKLRGSSAPHGASFPKGTFLFTAVLHSFCSLSPTLPHPQEFQQSLGPTSQPGEAEI